MDEIKISYDNQKFQSKPSGDMVRYISNRLAKSSSRKKMQAQHGDAMRRGR